MFLSTANTGSVGYILRLSIWSLLMVSGSKVAVGDERINNVTLLNFVQFHHMLN